MKKLFGQILLERSLVTQDQLDLALKEQKVTSERIGTILNRMGFLRRDDLLAVLSHVSPEKLYEENIEAQRLVPNSFLVENQTIIPVATDKDIFFATLNKDPDDIMDKIREIVGDKYNIQPINNVEYLFVVRELERLRDVESTFVNANVTDLSHIEDPNLLFELIESYAIDLNASDIHIEQHEKSIHIRYRVDGVLETFIVLDNKVKDHIFAIIKNKSQIDLTESRLPQDGSYSRFFKGRYIDFRVATLPNINGEKVTIRILDKEKAVLPLSRLGMSKLDEWRKIITQPNGLVLVCGPTGSGKSTTLASTIRELQRLENAIYTIENPVEYIQPYVVQTQVNPKVDLSFNRFLSAILRHDPDIIVVGEIRDPESAQATIRLAITGHLVFGTLHTNDVPSSIERLYGLEIEDIYVRSLLRGILVQKLVRKHCPFCKGKGCNKCRHTGLLGRTMFSEMATVKKPKDVQDILDSVNDDQKPYWDFNQEIKHKLTQNITSKEEIERVFNITIPASDLE